MATLLRSAFVIARRDFTATVFSKTFLFFLLGPLFPVLMGVIFGSISGSAISEAERPVVAVIASDADFRALAGARKRLDDAIARPPMLELLHVRPEPDAAAQRARLLALESPPIIGVLEGGLDHPRLIGGLEPEGNTIRYMRFLIQNARHDRVAPAQPVDVQLSKSRRSPGSLAPARAFTATAGQMVLFLL